MAKKRKIRFMFLAGVLLLAFIYLAPLWKISMGIPQYPKSIDIHIWINGIENGSPKAIEIMNVLNHNIGMQEIKPDSIKELKFFPYILLGLILSGVIITFINNKKFRLYWIIALVILLAAAFVDFYLWEYDYGHNLDPEAPLKVEGSSFQPPIIGVKMILNFRISSWPMTGAIFPLLSLFVTFMAVFIENRKKNET